MSKAQRIAVLFIAAMFLITTVAFTVMVVVEMGRGGRTPPAAQMTDEARAGALLGTQLPNFTPVERVESLQIIDLKVGTGQVVPPGATVTAHFTGAVAATGRIFQSTHDIGRPMPFSLNEVIEGWSKGVPGMQVGGQRRLLIPAAQAYGAHSPSPDIPPNADLVFDIEVIAIN